MIEQDTPIQQKGSWEAVETSRNNLFTPVHKRNQGFMAQEVPQMVQINENSECHVQPFRENHPCLFLLSQPSCPAFFSPVLYPKSTEKGIFVGCSPKQMVLALVLWQGGAGRKHCKHRGTQRQQIKNEEEFINTRHNQSRLISGLMKNGNFG